ncbi:MAG: hypothetical protein WCA51_08910 [Dehalococcoidia bacterium]
MKTMGNLKWKLALCVIGLAVMVGATFMASGTLFTTPVVSAAGTCTVTVDIPDSLNLPALGAKIDYYPWSKYKTDGQTFSADQGSTVTWILIVNGFSGKTFNFKVPNTETAILTVGPDAYCTMQVKNVPTGGQVNVYPWNTYWVDGQNVVVPIGGSCTWKLIVNGFSGDTYTKNFDCTPLDVTKAVLIVKSFCGMQVQMDAGLPANAQVNVYPWNTYWKNGDIITVPVGGSCTWKLIVNGFSGNSYTKKFDCSPLVVNSTHYCNMQVICNPAYKVNVYPWNTYWTNGQVIVVPIGGSCTWQLTGPGAPAGQHTKNFDCTDLNAGP